MQKRCGIARAIPFLKAKLTCEFLLLQLFWLSCVRSPLRYLTLSFASLASLRTSNFLSSLGSRAYAFPCVTSLGLYSGFPPKTGSQILLCTFAISVLYTAVRTTHFLWPKLLRCHHCKVNLIDLLLLYWNDCTQSGYMSNCFISCYSCLLYYSDYTMITSFIHSFATTFLKRLL